MHLKLITICLLLTTIIGINCQNRALDDEEFIEFDFEDEPNRQQTNKNQQKDLKEASIEIDGEDEINEKSVKKSPVTTSAPKVKLTQKYDDVLDNEEFENFVDEEEFEGLTSESTATTTKSPFQTSDSAKAAKPDLKIADVPQHLLSAGNWQNFVWEMVLLAGIFTYFFNFVVGRTRNSSIASTWFNTHQELLMKNFSLVGDDGSTSELPSEPKMIKESDYLYGLWCSGRATCLNMFIQLKLIKRQDLITQVTKFFKPMNDQVFISVEFDRNDIDSYVFCLANKKVSQNLIKDYNDLSTYCVEKKAAADKYDIPAKYVLVNELGEAASLILDPRVCAFLNKYPDMVEYLIVSDQYVGLKSRFQDEQPAATATNETLNELGLPNARSMLVLCLNIPGKGNPTDEDIEKLLPAMQFALLLLDKIPRLRLSKESKQRTIKKRKEITEAYQKISNKQRQEAAQQRKEEKRRAEKEKIMNESDPEKQRKLEEKELKREKKKNLSKLKQIKIKSM